MPKPIHCHSEQFDGWLHANCGSGDWAPPTKRCVGDDVFDALPRAVRCKKCTRINWPHGGDPE